SRSPGARAGRPGRAMNRLDRELVAALVLGDAGVTRDLHEAEPRERARLSPDGRDELHVLLRLVGAGEDADGVRGVGVDEDRPVAISGPQGAERSLDGRQLGDVVGPHAEKLADFLALLAAEDHGADPHRARVPGAGAVRIDDDPIAWSGRFGAGRGAR